MPVLLVFCPRWDTSDTVSCLRMAWHKECELKPISYMHPCMVVLKTFTPAADHSLWIPPTHIFHNPLQGVVIPIAYAHLFYHILFLTFTFILFCLDTELYEQPAPLQMAFCVLPLLFKFLLVSLGQQSGQQSSPSSCSLQNYTKRPFKALCGCLKWNSR